MTTPEKPKLLDLFSGIGGFSLAFETEGFETIGFCEYDEGYNPSNCIWATVTVQANNRRGNIKVDYQGKRLTVAQLSRICGVKYGTLYKRLKRGITPEIASQP